MTSVTIYVLSLYCQSNTTAADRWRLLYTQQMTVFEMMRVYNTIKLQENQRAAVKNNHIVLNISSESLCRRQGPEKDILFLHNNCTNILLGETVRVKETHK